MRKENLKYLVKLIDYHGEEILRNDKNNYYSKELKEEIINKVWIDGESIKSTSIKYGERMSQSFILRQASYIYLLYWISILEKSSLTMSLRAQISSKQKTC